SKLRARRGPREEPTGAYAVVREDRRRPRTKSGEVRLTGTRSELQHDDPGDGDAGAEQRGARQALAEEDPREGDREHRRRGREHRRDRHAGVLDRRDRKSTRLNSSHVAISYAVFCLKKKTQRR